MFLAYLLQALLCVLPLWVLQMPIWFDIVYILVTSFAPVIPFYGDMIAGVLRAAVFVWAGIAALSMPFKWYFIPVWIIAVWFTVYAALLIVAFISDRINSSPLL